MVRECRPPAREPGRSWLGRRSTMATSTPANANSPANISPVGPPPAITTACLDATGTFDFDTCISIVYLQYVSATVRNAVGLAARPRVRDILEMVRKVVVLSSRSAGVHGQRRSSRP